MDNLYRLDGRVPLGKAIPFGLQHVLAMFVSNLTPIILITGSARPELSQAQIAMLMQNAMFIAGIATIIQLYPVWSIGSRLPVSETFLPGERHSVKYLFDLFTVNRIRILVF